MTTDYYSLTPTGSSEKEQREATAERHAKMRKAYSLSAVPDTKDKAISVLVSQDVAVNGDGELPPAPAYQSASNETIRRWSQEDHGRLSYRQALQELADRAAKVGSEFASVLMDAAEKSA